jgi:hypothetical protein
MTTKTTVIKKYIEKNEEASKEVITLDVLYRYLKAAEKIQKSTHLKKNIIFILWNTIYSIISFYYF